MIQNNKDKIEQNDQRFENAIHIVHIGIIAIVALPVLYIIISMIIAKSFSMLAFFIILGIMVFGVFLWTLLDIIISYLIDIKFIRNNLQKPTEDGKSNPPDGSVDQKGFSPEYNPNRENPTSHMDYPVQKRPPDHF